MKSLMGYLLMGVALAAPAAAHAQASFPEKPIHLIVPFAAGGTTDILARLFGQKLSASLGQPVLVENRTGAGTMVGSEYVAKAPADGYTLLVGSSSVWMNPVLYKKVPYKFEDFVAVSTFARAPFVLSVPPNSQANSIADLVRIGKQNPGKFSYGTLGKGGTSHLVSKLFEQSAGITAADISYRGTALVMGDLVGGRLDFYFDGIGTSLPMYRSGKIKVLAVTSEQRSPAAPDIPTLKELGHPRLVVDTIWGVFAPAHTPRAVVDRLSKAIQEAATAPDLRSRLEADGTIAKGTSSEEFAAMVQKDLSVWLEIIRPMNLQLD